MLLPGTNTTTSKFPGLLRAGMANIAPQMEASNEDGDIGCHR